MPFFSDGTPRSGIRRARRSTWAFHCSSVTTSSKTSGSSTQTCASHAGSSEPIRMLLPDSGRT